MGTKRWYITTPIYYPSDRLHIGHAYTTVAADALARFHRLRGDAVWFVTGTDEHGQKIARLADAQGTTPQSMVDAIVEGIQDLWRTLAISHDDFIRTTEPRHEAVVQAVFQRLMDSGDIYRGEYEGWYCVPDETFWPESRLVEPGVCPECGRGLERVREDSYFLRLSKYQDRLLTYYREHPEFVEPASRLHEMVHFVEQGLEDLSISRKGLAWGIPVPGDPDHSIYVWFDALLNYLTAAGYPDQTQFLDDTWPPDVQLVGKEIVRFHTVTWPIILMALNLPLPRRVFGHGWLLLGDAKMSKSVGNVVEPKALVATYGVDAVRYYLLREVPFGADGSYTEDALLLRTNVDLANDLGNLLHRAVAMLERFNDGRIPPYHPDVDTPGLRAVAEEARASVDASMATLELNQAVQAVQRLVRAANKYIEDSQPWALHRDPGARPVLDNVLYNVAESLRVLSVLLTPFLVETPSKIRRQLGIDTAVASWEESAWGLLAGGGAVEPGEPLFPRRERRAVPEAVETAAVAASPAPVSTDLLSIDEFQRWDLRVADVVAAEPVPGADRLLKLTLAMGDERRIVVSGIAQHYRPEELVGRQVVLVANLKPVKLRGVESHGMILAASVPGGALQVVGPWLPIQAGSRVK